MSSAVLVLLALLVPGAATPPKLPRWRGFNLVEKCTLRGNKPYREQDFAMIAEWGFNFVRLPLDYRIWIRGGDWRQIDEGAFADIDQAVRWGEEHGLHVSLNIHRAPGYCVNPPPEPKDLWSDDEALEVCALHWAALARRYRGIPGARLSFDLLNEPKAVTGEQYLRVARVLVEAIRKEDPERWIIADGSSWGTRPVPELIGLGIAQSTRGYQPMEVSHYRASWVAGSDRWSLPSWPLRRGLPGYLYGPAHRELEGPLVLEGDFQPGSLTLHVDVVSSLVGLVIKADGKVIFEKGLRSGPGEGEWKRVVYREEHKVYQNVFDRDYVFALAESASELSLEVVEGDWLTWTSLAFSPGKREISPGESRTGPGEPEAGPGESKTGAGGWKISSGDQRWGALPGRHRLLATGEVDPKSLPPSYDRQTHWREQILPWKELEAKGVGVHVGEWGAFQHTPHDVVLAWMEDLLKNWKEADWGWALWNFRGSFGVLDSGRKDVQYESYRGHQLDRAMLELLRRY